MTWREEEPLAECLESLPLAAGQLDVEIILVANGTGAPLPATLDAHRDRFRMIHNETNCGVAAGRNQGMQLARGRYLLLLDVDTRLAAGTLEILVCFMDEHPQVGLAAPRLVDAQGRLQLSCRKFPSPWSKILRRAPAQVAHKLLADEMLSDWDHQSAREVDYCIGACQIIRREALEQVGQLEERIFYGPEDIDYCVRMWQHGWRVMYVPQAEVVHYEQRLTQRHFWSGLSLSHARGLLFFFQKYRHLLSLPKFPLRSQLRGALMLGDMALVNLVGLLALWLGVQRSRWWLATDWWDSAAAWFLFLTVVWFVLAEVNDLYDLRVAGIVSRSLLSTLRVVLGTLLVYLVLYFLAAPQSLPRHIIVFFALGSTALLSIWRTLFAVALSALPLRRRALILGAGASLRRLLQAIRENAPSYYDPICLVNGPAAWAEAGAGVTRVVGQIGQLADIVARERIDEIFLAPSADKREDLLQALVACREQGVLVRGLSEVYEQLTGRVPIADLAQEWMGALPWQQDPGGGLVNLLKRLADLLCALVSLILATPVCLGIMLAIRLDSPGPVFYRQPRVGKNGRVFSLLKFRTMIVNAEKPGCPTWAAADDPRVTRVGRFLRRWSLDEIPQLLNVLQGEMSLVGPRPERPEIVRALQSQVPFYRLRHAVRPGLTGWAAIHFGYGRSVEDARVKLEYDLFYIKHHSLYLDLLILLKTVGCILWPPRH